MSDGVLSNKLLREEHDVEGSGVEGCLGQARECSSRPSSERTSSELDFAEVRLSETMPVLRTEST